MEQAEAQLLKDQAVLENARIDLQRYESLIARNAVAQQVLQTQRATVAQSEATLKTDQASIDSATLNIAYCHITAPITGRVGLRLVDPGNYVTAGASTPLLVITQTQPISIIFTIPEQQLAAVRAPLRAGKKLRVDALDRNGQTVLASGELTTLDNQIDPTTGTLKLRATVANKDDALFPNQFVNARMLVQEKKGVTLVPNAAVQRNAQNDFRLRRQPGRVGRDSECEGRHDRRRALGDRVGSRTARADRARRRRQTTGRQPGRRLMVSGRRRPKNGPNGAPVATSGRSGSGGGANHESVTDIHPPADRHLAADDRHPAGGRGRLQAVARLGVAGSRLPDHPGDDVLSGRQPGRDGVVGDRSARAAVRPGARPPADDLHQFHWAFHHHPAVQPQLNIDVAEQEVQQSINASGTYLPADLPTPPIYSKINPADTPILTLALTSNALPLSKVEDLADTRLAPKISQLPGVGLVTHQRRPEARRPHSSQSDALASYGLNLEDLRSALVAANVNQAKGNFDGPHQTYQIGANDQLLSSERLRAAHHRVPERRTGQADRRGDRRRRRGERPPGGVG